MTTITEDGTTRDDDEERRLMWGSQSSARNSSFHSNLELVSAHNHLSEIEEESGMISDTASNFSNNSRNF